MEVPEEGKREERKRNVLLEYSGVKLHMCFIMEDNQSLRLIAQAKSQSHKTMCQGVQP